jgi:hypothetical protein
VGWLDAWVLFEGRFASIKEMKDKFGIFIGDPPKDGGLYSIGPTH